jgi:hypothetical protein
MRALPSLTIDQGGRMIACLNRFVTSYRDAGVRTPDSCRESGIETDTVKSAQQPRGGVR